MLSKSYCLILLWKLENSLLSHYLGCHKLTQIIGLMKEESKLLLLGSVKMTLDYCLKNLITKVIVPKPIVILFGHMKHKFLIQS